MAKDFDKNGKRFETGQPCTYNGEAYTVAGGHEDGVSLVDADGHRTTVHATGDKCDDIEITGEAPDAAGLEALHAKWVEQADANRLAAAKG